MKDIIEKKRRNKSQEMIKSVVKKQLERLAQEILEKIDNLNEVGVPLVARRSLFGLFFLDIGCGI